MPVKELPILITPTIASDPDRMAKAVMRNFDHLIGESGYISSQIEVGSLSDKLQEAVDEGVFVPGEPDNDALVAELNAEGVGPADGSPPAGSITDLRIIGGVGNMIIMDWSLLANNSPVTYEVHVHTTNGFVPGANTLVGTFKNPGGAVTRGGGFVLRTFPTGHLLAGQVIQPGTTYYAVVVPKDEDGAGTPSNQASGTSTLITTTQIGPNAITSPLIAANQVVAGHIASGEITTGHMTANTINGDRIQAGTLAAAKIVANSITSGQIQAGSITADRLNVSSLSAITATLGSVSAGSILSGSLSTGTGLQSRISLGPGFAWSDQTKITFYGPSPTAWEGEIGWSSARVYVSPAFESLGYVQCTRLIVGSVNAGPPANHASIWTPSGTNQLRARFPDGTVKEFTMTVV